MSSKEKYYCRECGGDGIVEVAANAWDKSAAVPDWQEEECPECDGTGYCLPDDWEYDDE